MTLARGDELGMELAYRELALLLATLQKGGHTCAYP